MKRKLLSLGMLGLLCLAAPNVFAQNPAVTDSLDNVSPELQARIRVLIATLGPDPSRNTCSPNSALPANQARYELTAIGKPATLPLCAVLGERDVWRRDMASEALIEIRDPRALQPLLRTLRFDRNSTVRANAAAALGNLGDKEAVPLLIAALEFRNTSRYALSPAYAAGKAAEALGKLGDARAVPPLLAMLGSREDFLTSLPMGTASPLGTEVAKALGKLGTAAAEPLMRLLDDPNPKVRVDAAKALGVMKEKRAVPLLLRCLSNDKALNAEIERFLDDANPNRAAIEALGEIGDKQATLPLLEKLDVKRIQDGKDIPGFYSDIIEALGKLGDPQAVPTLLQLLSAKNHSWRKTVLIALARIRAPEVAEPLLDALPREKEYYVSSEITEALGRMKETRALPALQQLLKDNNVGDNAAVAIGRIDSTFLIPLLQDENQQVRRAVVHGLGETGSDQAVDLLVTLIRDTELKTEALLALGKLGTPDLLPLLEPLMREPKNSNPWAARRAVIEIKKRHKL